MNNNTPLPITFIDDVEKKSKYILLGDTDSLFINLPDVKINYDNIQDSIDKCEHIAKEINKLNTQTLNNYILPKMGIDPKYNRTFFKTEIIASSILLLPIKKNYSYQMIAKEGKKIQPGIIKYTGINVKSDMPKWTKRFLTTIIEDYILSSNIDKNQIKNEINKLVINEKKKIENYIKTYDFIEVGSRKKWGKKDDANHIIPMKLYNSLVNDKIFTPFSAGYLIPIKIKNPLEFNNKIDKFRHINDNKFLENIAIDKLKYLAIPYKHNIEKLKNIFDEYGIYVEFNDIWDVICNKTIKTIIEILQSNLDK